MIVDGALYHRIIVKTSKWDNRLYADIDKERSIPEFGESQIRTKNMIAR